MKNVLAAAALASVIPATGWATTAPCADRASVVDALMEQFGEAPSGTATSSGAEMLEVYANETAQTWTVLLSLPERGLACVVASGSGDADLSEQLAGLSN
jgi:hypothetical protein